MRSGQRYNIFGVGYRVRAPIAWDDDKGQEVNEKLAEYFSELENKIEADLLEIDPKLRFMVDH